MKGLLFVLGAGVLKAIYTTLFLRRASRHQPADPDAIKHVRLTPEGSGWLYEYGWPRRKRRSRPRKE